jgi:hypothetical protein
MRAVLVAAIASTALPLALLWLLPAGPAPGGVDPAWLGGGTLAAIIALGLLATAGIGPARCRTLVRSFRAGGPPHPPPRLPPSKP